jgi:hypothetical protein
MTAAKTKPAAPAEVWGRCPCPPGCGRERRVVDGDEGPAMVQHRRYSSWEREMIWCPGSGQPSAEAGIAA